MIETTPVVEASVSIADNLLDSNMDQGVSRVDSDVTLRTSGSESSTDEEREERGREAHMIKQLKEELKREKERVAQLEASAKADNGNVRTEIPEWLSSVGEHIGVPEKELQLFVSQSVQRSRRERGGRPNSGMSEYMRFMALPEVQLFSGRDKDYSFENFRDCFELKYPKDYWTDKERCALFKAKLTVRAKAQYEALPRAKREAGYAVLVKALREACQAESRNRKIVALSELKRLRKEEGQLVMDFCVELERLTRKAYPELDERALSVVRADHLYDQLSPWDESCQLQAVLEGPGADMYERLKDAAMRVERRRLSQRNKMFCRYKQRSPDKKSINDAIKKEELDVGGNRRQGMNKEESRETGRARELKCFNCGEVGHKSRVCKKGKRDTASKPVALDELEFSVPNDSHILHAQFRCRGQEFPAVNGSPSFPMSTCCVQARLLSIWSGLGSISNKVQQIMNPAVKRIDPRSVGFALVEPASTMRHGHVSGDWTIDFERIFELGWNIARRMVWEDVKTDGILEKIHNRVLVVIPTMLARMRFMSGSTRTRFFYYGDFSAIRTKNDTLFTDDVGAVIIVLPAEEPRKVTAWLALLSAIDLWVTCGARVLLVNGPRSTNLISWEHVTQRMRSHLLSYISMRPERAELIIDLLQRDVGTVDTQAAWMAISSTGQARNSGPFLEIISRINNCEKKGCNIFVVVYPATLLGIPGFEDLPLELIGNLPTEIVVVKSSRITDADQRL
ncbi:unnamed protein product [Nippostrongylus brasiliensis]|uniref:CCHC-type domain-containing protein n=1 Tax=Nippostrongylus brasiliensis TaxID=27835 RepID=A0A0N4XTW7_NIPBR|nr:unnamed protein product [Nippostrongylus brasiliensis]